MKLVKFLIAVALCCVIVESSNINRKIKNKEAKGYLAECNPAKIMDSLFGQCKSGLKCDKNEKICLVKANHNCADMTDKNHKLLSSRTLKCVRGHICLYKSGDWTQGDPEWRCTKLPK